MSVLVKQKRAESERMNQDTDCQGVNEMHVVG